MNESTTIALRGRVGSVPAAYELKGKSGEPPKPDPDITVRFRLGVSRWRRTDGGVFVQDETHWYTVRVWGQLAKNVMRSVGKGDPLLVVGRPSANAWLDRDAKEARAELVVTADAIGFDMNHGMSRFIRPPRKSDSEDEQQSAPGQQEQPDIRVDADDVVLEAGQVDDTRWENPPEAPGRPLGTVAVRDPDAPADDLDPEGPDGSAGAELVGAGASDAPGY